LLREPPVKSARRVRRPFRSATAWPNDIRYTTGVTPKSICIGPAWPDMANKNDWQSAAANAVGSSAAVAARRGVG
jgi:hypothetical protein